MAAPLFPFHPFFRTPNGALRVWAEPVDPGASAAHVELAQGAIKDAFVLFSTTLLGLVGFVLQNHSFFAALTGVVKPRQPLCGLILSNTVFRIFESTAVAGSGVLAPLLGLPLVEFRGSLGRFRIH
jgi:hypothetical protein